MHSEWFGGHQKYQVRTKTKTKKATNNNEAQINGLTTSLQAFWPQIEPGHTAFDIRVDS